MTYNPMASSLTRQAWEYQQTLIDMMGEGLEGLGEDAPSALTLDPNKVVDPSSIDLEGSNLALAVGGIGVLAAAIGVSAAKLGVVPTALGVLAGILVIKRL